MTALTTTVTTEGPPSTGGADGASAPPHAGTASSMTSTGTRRCLTLTLAPVCMVKMVRSAESGIARVRIRDLGDGHGEREVVTNTGVGLSIALELLHARCLVSPLRFHHPLAGSAHVR